MKGFRWKSFCHLEPESGLVGYRKGIGQIGCVVGVVKVIAIITEEHTHTVTFRVQGIQTEGVIGMNGPFLAGGVDQCLHLSWEVHILDGVNGVERIEGDGIANLRFLGVLLREKLVSDVSTEIAVVL